MAVATSFVVGYVALTRAEVDGRLRYFGDCSSDNNYMPDARWLGLIVWGPLIVGLGELAGAAFVVRGRRGFGLLMLAGLTLCASALTAALLVSYAQYIHSCD